MGRWLGCAPGDILLPRPPESVPQVPFRERSSVHPQTRACSDLELTWRIIPMRVRAGVGRRAVVPQGGVPFTAVRGGKREGASELRVGGRGRAQGAGSREKPPPCCEKRMLSNWHLHYLHYLKDRRARPGNCGCLPRGPDEGRTPSVQH